MKAPLIIRALTLSIIACLAVGQARAVDVGVNIRQLAGDAVEVRFSLTNELNVLRFASVPGDYRRDHWRVATPGFRIITTPTEDRIERIDGAAFKQVTLTARPNTAPIVKNYRPLIPFGQGGVMVFTGHFWPIEQSIYRLNAVFSFTPSAGAYALSFNERKPRLSYWVSPTRHPAYVYLGSLQPVETEDVMALVSPTAPQWLKDEFAEMIPVVFERLADTFEFPLAVKPNLFLIAQGSGRPGVLSFAGDAVPGQFQLTLDGGGWASRNKKALDIFRRSTIHEAVHLWQTAARPQGRDTPGWIHEGAADAISAEMMVELGYWTFAEYAQARLAAQEECAAELYKGPLAHAAIRGNFRALYACGQVIAEAVAEADGASVGEFWREFIELSRVDPDGFSADDFYNLVEERTGSRSFVSILRSFVQARQANGKRSIDTLNMAARNL